MLLPVIVNAEGLRVIGRDYSFVELVDAPYGVGLASWSDNEEEFTPGIYAQMGLMSYDSIRFSLGVVSAWKIEDERIGIRPITSITFLFKMRSFNMELGGYYGPFYTDSDPYGIMIGFAFNLGQ